MQRSGSVLVTGKDGLRGVLDRSTPVEGRTDPSVLIRLENGRQVVVPEYMLAPQPDGSYQLPVGLADLEQANTGRDAAGETLVIPVVKEELEIQRRKLETGGVRVSTVVHEREEVVDQPLIKERVHVEHVPINRVVDGPVPIRHEGHTMVIPLLEEVLVVEKRLMLKEEVHITKEQYEERQPQRVVLRSEEARVERLGDDGVEREAA
jgi:uncharacterized protein (TIGR02271 family)